ncbi:MAG: DUF4860 domain-containing protein [Lachnospirales bacterium]
MKKNELVNSISVYFFLIAILVSITLILVAVKNFNNRLENDAINNDIEVAYTYVDTILRKNDVEGAINIAENPFEDNKYALKITRDLDELWVFSYEGQLVEVVCKYPNQPNIDDKIVIANNIDFDVYKSTDDLLTYTFYDVNNHGNQYVGKLLIKSDKG